ncbi:unnamed protein product, partial [Amoebophrya sp. A25]
GGHALTTGDYRSTMNTSKSSTALLDPAAAQNSSRQSDQASTPSRPHGAISSAIFDEDQFLASSGKAEPVALSAKKNLAVAEQQYHGGVLLGSSPAKLLTSSASSQSTSSQGQQQSSSSTSKILKVDQGLSKTVLFHQDADAYSRQLSNRLPPESIAVYLDELREFLRQRRALDLLYKYCVFISDHVNAGLLAIQLFIISASWDSRVGHLHDALAQLQTSLEPNRGSYRNSSYRSASALGDLHDHNPGHLQSSSPLISARGGGSLGLPGSSSEEHSPVDHPLGILGADTAVIDETGLNFRPSDYHLAPVGAPSSSGLGLNVFSSSGSSSSQAQKFLNYSGKNGESQSDNFGLAGAGASSSRSVQKNNNRTKNSSSSSGFSSSSSSTSSASAHQQHNNGTIFNPHKLQQHVYVDLLSGKEISHAEIKRNLQLVRFQCRVCEALPRDRAHLFDASLWENSMAKKSKLSQMALLHLSNATISRRCEVAEKLLVTAHFELGQQIMDFLELPVVEICVRASNELATAEARKANNCAS